MGDSGPTARMASAYISKARRSWSGEILSPLRSIPLQIVIHTRFRRPPGSLDTKSGAKIVGLLEEPRDEGRTLIIVTHDEGLARRLGRTIRLLDGGATP